MADMTTQNGKLVFLEADIIKDPVLKNGQIEYENIKKELTLARETEQGTLEQVADPLLFGKPANYNAQTSQRATVEQRTAGGVIPSITKALADGSVTIVSDIGASRVRNYAIYPSGDKVIPIFNSILDPNADQFKENSEVNRKGFIIYNNSGVTCYIGTQTEVLDLQKNGLPILAGQSFSDAFMNSNLNIIMDASSGALFQDIRVYITYL